ncbi:UDP-N-acetyl-D-glucosamine dehydrogenase [Cellulomonas chitinilytica]|uniref:UDP-N-acetyl-D-glucosamine dehydrogenase n=1 Tax=Cellulomonas chitinilytica TaxID=398759 RepID=A0A919P3U8_9CELL|nr:nucleotide sugar dehydrogenase [Cellulomonas chitinilytica]GIG20579.1 UDP-N-acetyl-D-glucosamine dehydrogenase [Cellulomonas chitinilytica]
MSVQTLVRPTDDQLVPSFVEDRTRSTVYDVAIVGLGYVGLPLAQEACRTGMAVAGYDLSTRVVDGLVQGRSHVDDLSDADVRDMTAAGFTPGTDASVLAQAAVIVICVPTPLSATGGPDLGAVRGAVRTVGEQLQPGTLVILESTTYPGTTEDVVAPMLEEFSGLRAGRDFALAFSPERVDPGNARFGIRNTPKVVGGLTPTCTERTVEFYGRVVDRVVPVRSTREAETAKLLENTYRQVNIALVNELARAFHELDIDVWDVIDAASTKPFGFQAFRPGVGVGGHCIPIDPMYLNHQVLQQLGRPLRMVELAQEINTSQPSYVVARVSELLGRSGLALQGATVHLLGVTYKANIADDRESPAHPLAELLVAAGAHVTFHDPLVREWDVAGVRRVSDAEQATAVAGADVVVLVQDHDGYDVDALALAARTFLDTKGAATTPVAHKL